MPAAICAALVRNNDDVAALYRFIGWYFVWLQFPLVFAALAWLVLRPIAVSGAALLGKAPFMYPIVNTVPGSKWW